MLITEIDTLTLPSVPLKQRSQLPAARLFTTLRKLRIAFALFVEYALRAI